MADFYVAVPSYVSPEFSTNTRASFKVRLAHRLEFPDDEWEVALSALSLADTSSDLSPLVQDPDTRLVVSKLTTIVKRTAATSSVLAHVDMKEMNDMNVVRRMENGMEFMRSLLDLLTYSENVDSLKVGMQIKKRTKFNGTRVALAPNCSY